jgi:hypothetical protein
MAPTFVVIGLVLRAIVTEGVLYLNKKMEQSNGFRYCKHREDDEKKGCPHISVHVQLAAQFYQHIREFYI